MKEMPLLFLIKVFQLAQSSTDVGLDNTNTGANQSLSNYFMKLCIAQKETENAQIKFNLSIADPELRQTTSDLMIHTNVHFLDIPMIYIHALQDCNSQIELLRAKKLQDHEYKQERDKIHEKRLTSMDEFSEPTLRQLEIITVQTNAFQSLGRAHI